MKLKNGFFADYETQQSIDFTIVAFDEFGGSTEKSFSVEILNGNEKPLITDIEGDIIN